MCSVGDDVLDDNPQKYMLEEQHKVFHKCNKCRTEPPCVVLRKKDAYCKGCFLAGTTHKFKALLGKSRLVRPNDRVLVCYEVGHPSTALLHFLRTGLDLNTPKKLRFEPVIVFIDDQYHLSVDERKSLAEQVDQHVEQFGFKSYFVSLAKYVENVESISNIVDKLDFDETDATKLEQCLYRKANNTSRNDLRRIFKRQLLVDVAKYLRCQFVFTSEISNDVANQLLTDISLGRGHHVPIDTGFCDDRDANVKILRPLRLFDMKELGFYNKFHNNDPLYIRQKERNAYSSVQDLMKKFVTDLQVNFPATVTTIIKTGDKLSLDRENKRSCKLCKGSIHEQSGDLKSEESTRFSHLVSTELVDHQLLPQETSMNLIGKFREFKPIDSDYCYGCNKLVSNS